MLSLFSKFIGKLENAKDYPVLIFRLILAYGFYGPAMQKAGNVDGIAQWFSSMNYPLPTLNAYLATGTEVLGFVLLFLGLATRIITLPLMVVMIVAIGTIHLGNGFEAGNNGFEIPLYYLAMLLSIFIIGPGKFSLDRVIENKLVNNKM
jgi:putative oxidoreductase